jgi:hypothetical protein
LAIAKDLVEISHVELPRSYGLDRNRPVQIHAFSDASFDALGTVVFVKQFCEKVSIVGSKGKVVGHKAKQSATIPQLELSAMTLCAKYVNSVVNVLEADYPRISLHCWTDTEIALHWTKI